jgi:hypothetical protein
MLNLKVQTPSAEPAADECCPQYTSVAFPEHSQVPTVVVSLHAGIPMPRRLLPSPIFRDLYAEGFCLSVMRDIWSGCASALHNSPLLVPGDIMRLHPEPAPREYFWRYDREPPLPEDAYQFDGVHDLLIIKGMQPGSGAFLLYLAPSRSPWANRCNAFVLFSFARTNRLAAKMAACLIKNFCYSCESSDISILYVIEDQDDGDDDVVIKDLFVQQSAAAGGAVTAERIYLCF